MKGLWKATITEHEGLIRSTRRAQRFDLDLSVPDNSKTKVISGRLSIVSKFLFVIQFNIVCLGLLRNFLKVSFDKVWDIIIIVVIGRGGSSGSSGTGLCGHALKLRQVIHAQLRHNRG